MYIPFKLPEAARKADGSLAIEEFRIILSGGITLTVQRDEFYSAVLHYKGREAALALAQIEAGAHLTDSTKLALAITQVVLIDYMEAMFKGGRWRDRDLAQIETKH